MTNNTFFTGGYTPQKGDTTLMTLQRLLGATISALEGASIDTAAVGTVSSATGTATGTGQTVDVMIGVASTYRVRKLIIINIDSTDSFDYYPSDANTTLTLAPGASATIVFDGRIPFLLSNIGIVRSGEANADVGFHLYR